MDPQSLELEGRKAETRILLLALLTGFLWGFAEGTAFFLVPDILLCYWALRSWRAALYSTAAVVLGALIAAIWLYLMLGSSEAFQADIVRLWQKFPGVKLPMLEVAAAHLREGGARGLLFGPSSGIPYRIYILEAWKQKIALQDLLLWTPIARLERLAIAPLAVLALHFGTRHFFVHKWKKLTLSRLKLVWIFLITVYWVALYAWYWGVFLPKTYY